MAKLLKLRRGTDTQHSSFTGAEGEVTVNTTNDSLHVHDGTTAGGTELAKADLSNVDGSLSNNLGFADGTKALFGTGNDLEIYHNGSDSVISDLGTGDLYIKSSSTFIRTGTNESMANFNADGSVQLYHDNSQKLATTSTGIDVTGTVTCDGLTSDGEVTVQSSAGVLSLKDTDSSGNATNNYIQGQNTNGANRWRVGQTTTGNENLYIQNFANTPIVFSTNGSNRVVIQSDGHLVPNDDDSYDLGTSSAQWRDGWFDGTVNCDGLDVDGNVNINAGHDTTLTIQGTGNAGLVLNADTDNTDETDIPKITFRQDGAINYFNIGVEGTDGTAFTGSRANTPYLEATSSQTNGIDFATNSTRRVTLNNNGHWVPAANNTYDLGETGNRWRNVYTNDLNLSNEGGTNDVDGTWGSWTIQEGEDDLFLLNRRNGKKYKFNLSEVN